MRRGGKLRYIAVRGLGSGAGVAAALIGVAWIKSGSLTLTTEAVIGFIIVSLMSAVSARSEWNKFASIYPDIGSEREGAGR
jgi:hypothetical protein